MHYNHILCKKLKIYAAETSCSPAKAPQVHSSGPLSQSLAIQEQQWDTGRGKVSGDPTHRSFFVASAKLLNLSFTISSIEQG